MANQTIKPVSPVTKASNNLQQKKVVKKNHNLLIVNQRAQTLTGKKLELILTRKKSVPANYGVVFS